MKRKKGPLLGDDGEKIVGKDSTLEKERPTEGRATDSEIV